MNPQAKYLVMLVITVVVVAASAFVANVTVDPYGIYRYVTVPGFNAIKPAAQTQVRLAKAYQLRNAKPEALVLGNSRVETGIDTDLASSFFNRKIFNVGLPGSSIYELFRYLQHAQAISPLRHVVVALDIFSFDTARSLVSADYLEERLAVDVDGVRYGRLTLNRLRDLRSIYFSVSSIDDMVLTIAHQEKAWASDRTRTGFNPMIEGGYYLAKGYHDIFFRKSRSYYQRLTRRGLSFAPSEFWNKGSFDYLRSIVDFCRKNGIELRMFIHPYHAHVLEILHRTDHWEKYETWKREIVSILEDDRVRHPDAVAFQLWDFGDYNFITTEEVPKAGDTTTEMRWYWEASHYKSSVGTELTKRMYGVGKPVEPDQRFGTKLDVNNLEAHLTRIREDRARYIEVRSDELSKLENLLQ